MSDVAETIEYKGYTIEIMYDSDPINPIVEWDILPEICAWHRRYSLGNSERFGEGKGKGGPEECREYAGQTRSLLLPLYMYEHSGIGLSLRNDHYPYNCRWDAGQLGYVLFDRERVLAEYGGKVFTAKLKRRCIKMAERIIETYNDYLSGNVYGYVVHVEDSCWGYYGDEGMQEAIREAKSIVDYRIKEAIKAHAKQVKQWIRHRVPLIRRKPLQVRPV